MIVVLQVAPLEPSSEYLLEVLEDAQDDRHTDLYYPQFCVTEDMETQLIQAEAPAKKVTVYLYYQ